MRSQRSLLLLSLVSALCLPSRALAAPSDAPSDTVRLRFGWRPGMQAWVDYEASRTRIGAGKDVRTQAAWKWRLSVSAHDKGLAVRTDSIQLTRSHGDTPVEMLTQRLAVMTPVHLVSRKGEFVGLQNVEGFRAGVMSLMDSLLAASPSVPPGARATFEKIYSDAFVQATASESWNSIVGAWMLGDLELGETYVAETSSPSPAMPQLQVPLALEFSVVRRLPCGRSERSDCVEITLNSYPDSAKTREVLARFFESLEVPDREKLRAAIEGTHAEAELRTVTRPDGLLPESVVVTKRVTVASEEGGRPVKVVQEDVKTYRFRWVK